MAGEVNQSDDDGANDWALPPGPRCEHCGHEMCPCCGTWCDLLVEAIGPDTSDEYVDDWNLCCGGECVVDPVEVDDWMKRVAAAESGAPKGAMFLTQDGPYCPTWRRSAAGW
jgi:hypothetical protein